MNNEQNTNNLSEPNLSNETPVNPEVTPISSTQMNPQIEDNGVVEPQNSINNQNQTTGNIEQLDASLNVAPTIETFPNDSVESLDVPIETLEDVQTPTKTTEQSSPVPNIQKTNSKIPVDNFTAVPSPPVFEEKAPEKKKKNNKMLLVIVLIIILIGIIGFGLYYFLNTSKNKSLSSITPKDVALELGDSLSDNVSDYANILGYNKENCSVDTKYINVNKVGAYKFSVTCNENKVEGKLTIDDTKAPNITTTELVVLPNATIKPEDFIETCVDASECSYKFNNQEEVNNNLSSIGEYEIEILVSDGYDNETTVKANLIVSNNAPVKYVTCTSQSIDVDDIYASLTESYKIGVDSKNNFYNAVKSSEFKFDDNDDYLSIKNNYNETTGIHNIIGKSTFNDDNKSIILKGDRTLDEINQELNTSFTGDMTTIQMLLTIKQYTCE